MSELFLKLLNMSITASWLILAVVVLRLVLKKAPKWINCVLWALVAMRLICPFSFESNLSLVPDIEPVGQSVNQSILNGDIQVDDVTGEIEYVESDPIYDPAGETHPNTGNWQSDGILPQKSEAAWSAADTAAAVWLAGVVVLLLYALISYLRLRRRVSAAMLLRENIWLCDAVESPFILGFFRPRIYLPSNITEGDMEHVLAHERAHLQRRDHWWKPLGYVLLAVYWFNPLIWVAYILLCRDIELACDEKVINRPDTDRKAYSEALLACSVKRSAITACPLAFGEVGVRGRIKSVLNYKKPAFWIILVALVACIVAAVCFLTDPLKPTVHDVADQKGYKITAVTRYVTMPVSVPVDVLGEDIYSNEGHFFEPDEVVVYQSDTTTVYLRHVRYLEQYGEEQLYFDFRFAYEILDEGTVRTLFTPNIENGETVSSTLGGSVPDKTAWDSSTTYPDGARLYGVNQGVEVSVAIQTDVVRVAQDYIAFTLGSLTDITYETGKANHEDDIRYLSEDQAETAFFGQSYRVVETTYVDGSYSFVMTPENAPKFHIDEDKNLIEISGESPNRMETYLGVLKETELTKENFDNWFHPIGSETGMWENGLNAAKIRRDNQSAWALTQGNEGRENSCLLLQKNGDLYLTYGLRKTDQGEMRIRWLLKLEKTEDIGAINGADDFMSNTFVSSEVDASNPALETAIEYVIDRMETFNEGWETIAPGNSTTRGKVTALESVASVAMENIRLDLYRLEYRLLLNGNVDAVLVGGMSHEEIDGEIWLTEWDSAGQPYILHYSAMEDGRIDWKTICMTSTEEIGMIYAENKETQHGQDKYTIAARKLYEKYLENGSSNTDVDYSILNGDEPFSDQPLEITKDPMTYQERLDWVKSGTVYTEKLEDGGESPTIALGQWQEGYGCLAYVWQYYGSPHPGVYYLTIRFADGTQARLPLPDEQTYRTAKPTTMEFRNGKFVYDVQIDSEWPEDESIQKRVYHYKLDLAFMTLSLSLNLAEGTADSSVADAMLAAVETLLEEQLSATISMMDEMGRIHPVYGKLNAWDSINGKNSCRAILEHTYQMVDSIETSDTQIILEFAVDGVDWGLVFYEGTDTLSVFTGGIEYLLQATPKQEDVFLSPLGNSIRRWYDEAEYMALDGYDGKTIVVPNTGQDYLEAAQDWYTAYEGRHLMVSSGSKKCYTFVSCRVEPAEGATSLYREKGEIGENTYAFFAYTVFVPENEQALLWSVAGNTGEYEGNAPDVPKEALEYSRCGYITLEEDGWHGVIVGTGF